MIEHTEEIRYDDPPDVILLPLCAKTRKWCLDTQNRLRESGFSALADLRRDPAFGTRLRMWFEKPSVEVALFAGDDEWEKSCFTARKPGSHARVPVSLERLEGYLRENGCVKAW